MKLLEFLRAELVERMLNERDIYNQIVIALNKKSALSIVRIGDGEALTLAQNGLFSIDEIKKRGPFLSYAGVNVPDLKSKDDLCKAILNADIVGIPTSPLENFMPLTLHSFDSNNINPFKLNLTSSLINYTLFIEGYISKILYRSGLRVLLVGNRMSELERILSQKNINIVKSIYPVKGVTDHERIVKEMYLYDFDIALVSAGISAVMICSAITKLKNVVALDFGHLSDEIIKGAKWI
ncbi:GT-D fold domain-containing glycosyltransferase [Wukongibacter baidiensis]|uniref:GT-D fold domain-containing protein n=1 Tax=Wukongibacter baidiensis TaxID=1723361 RepID=UPI003D800166